MNEILNLKDLAEFLHVHPSTIYRLMKHGKLRSFKVGSDYRFRLVDVNAWIAEQTKKES